MPCTRIEKSLVEKLKSKNELDISKIQKTTTEKKKTVLLRVICIMQ